MFLHNQPRFTMTAIVKPTESKTFQGWDTFIGILCIAVSGVSAIGIAISLALGKNPVTIFVLSPLGGLAQCLLWDMYRNHRTNNRDTWKHSIKNALRHLNAAHKELKWYFSELEAGWKGFLAGMILTFLVVVKAIIPLIVYSTAILLAGTVFSLFIRIMMFAFGR